MPLPPPTVPLVLQDFLNLLDRIFPSAWLAPLKSPGPGYEVLQADAAVMARVSTAIANTAADAFIGSASGGAYATGSVKLIRPSPLTTGVPVPGQAGLAANIVAGAPGGQMRVTGLTGIQTSSVGHYLVLSNTGNANNTGFFKIVTRNSATSVDVLNGPAFIPDPNNGAIIWSEQIFVVTVKKGTILTTSNGGRDFFTLQDVTFNQADTGPFSVPIQAVLQGYEWNVPGLVVTATGEILPGDIDTIKMLVEDPPLGDLSIILQQSGNTQGGKDAALDQLGADRGMPRQPGESDTAYRFRISNLPDTVSPDAILRTCHALLDPIPIPFTFTELWDIGFQTCWNGPRAAIAGSIYNPNLFAYNDPRPSPPINDRWLDVNTARGGFMITVGNVGAIRDNGFAFNDTTHAVTDLNTPGVTNGRRAASAWNCPTTSVTLCPAWSSAGLAVDGGKAAAYQALYNALQQAKPAGVTATIQLAGQ